VENAENDQEEGNSPLLIADRNDAFVLVNKHKMMYLDPKDADTDLDYISDDRNDDFDGVNRNHAFDNDFDLDRMSRATSSSQTRHTVLVLVCYIL
jgi:hypothetical protein